MTKSRIDQINHGTSVQITDFVPKTLLQYDWILQLCRMLCGIANMLARNTEHNLPIFVFMRLGDTLQISHDVLSIFSALAQESESDSQLQTNGEKLIFSHTLESSIYKNIHQIVCTVKPQL